MKNDLKVITDGVIEGRKTFGNTIKYIQMAISSNFGNMFSAAGASIFLPFLPMIPIQLLLNNLLYSFAQLALPIDNVDETYVQNHSGCGLRSSGITCLPSTDQFDF